MSMCSVNITLAVDCLLVIIIVFPPQLNWLTLSTNSSPTPEDVNGNDVAESKITFLVLRKCLLKTRILMISSFLLLFFSC